jgi:hypothetical protein
LAAALCGVLLEKSVPRRLATITVSILLSYALMFSVVNRTRSLVRWSRVDDVYKPRAVQYFADQHEGEAATDIALANAVDALPCGELAIDAYTGLPARELQSSIHAFFVYPILALSHVDGHTRTARYVAVDNLSQKFAQEPPRRAPCAVICLNCAATAAKWDLYQHDGSQAQVFGRNVLFTSK